MHAQEYLPGVDPIDGSYNTISHYATHMMPIQCVKALTNDNFLLSAIA